MSLEKLKPWNWFKHENAVNNDNRQIPVDRNEAGSQNLISNADSFFRLRREMDRLIDDMFNAYGMPGVRSSLTLNWLPGNPASGTNLAGSTSIVLRGVTDHSYELCRCPMTLTPMKLSPV